MVSSDRKKTGGYGTGQKGKGLNVSINDAVFLHTQNGRQGGHKPPLSSQTPKQGVPLIHGGLHNLTIFRTSYRPTSKAPVPAKTPIKISKYAITTKHSPSALEKGRAISLDSRNKTHHHQTSSLNKQSGSRPQPSSALHDGIDPGSKTLDDYGPDGSDEPDSGNYERSFLADSRRATHDGEEGNDGHEGYDSRALSALDAKLNALQHLIYGTNKCKSNAKGRRK